MTAARRHALLALAAVTLSIVPTEGRAHDFEETRRLVLSVDAERVELLVAYEVRPGRVADSLRARYDAGDDGVVAGGLERLARAQVVGPRVRHGLSLVVNGRAVPLTVERLAFPTPTIEGGRRGVAAVALYSTPLPTDAWDAGSARITVRTRGARGQLTLEAQATEGYEMTGAGLESRSGDPVLGPGALSSTEAVTLTVSRAPAAR
jgi:hypothetical protein